MAHNKQTEDPAARASARADFIRDVSALVFSPLSAVERDLVSALWHEQRAAGFTDNPMEVATVVGWFRTGTAVRTSFRTFDPAKGAA